MLSAKSVFAVPSFAQRYVSHRWIWTRTNMDAWYHFEDGNPDAQQGDPAQLPITRCRRQLSLDSGTNARIRISTLPEGVIPGELN